MKGGFLLLFFVLAIGTVSNAQVSGSKPFFAIGANKDGNYKFRGEMALLRIYKTALNDKDIRFLAVQKPDITVKDFNPETEWLFWEKKDTLLTSSAGNNNGLIIGNLFPSVIDNVKSVSFRKGFVKAAFPAPLAQKEEFSIEAWVNVNTPNSNMFILSGAGESGHGIYLQIKDELIIFSDGKNVVQEQWNYRQRKWLHIVITKSGKAGATIFVNGVHGDIYNNSNKIHLVGKSKPPDNPLVLWYRTPALNWSSSMVIGNGHLGGMVTGGVNNENIYLNYDQLWSGEPRNDQSMAPDFLKSLPEVRRLLLEGKNKEAEVLGDSTMLTRYNESYMPMGMMHIQFPFEGDIHDYQRRLDLNNSIATVDFVQNGIKYTREIFASNPDKVMVVKLTASKAGALRFSASLRSLLHHATLAEGKDLVLNGRCPKHVDADYMGTYDLEYDDSPKGQGIRFQIRLRAILDGGKMDVSSHAIAINNANSVTLILTAESSFNGFDKSPVTAGKDYNSICKKNIELIKGVPYGKLRDRHIKDYQSLFQRAGLTINDGQDNNDNIPTDERIKNYHLKKDNSFAALYWQFGRYLLISGSRKGSQSLNLQGIWNKNIEPAWAGNYTLNCNTEINYWPAEVANLAACHQPLIDMTKRLSVDGTRTAKQMYGTDGWVAHHNTDIWMTATPVSGSVGWVMIPIGGAWLTQHLWEHYAFSKDKAYLKSVWPYIKGAAVFFTQNLVREKAHNWLVTSPDVNFENRFVKPDGSMAGLCMGSTASIEMVRQVFENSILISKILNTDIDLRKKIEEILPQLAPFQISPSTGELQEWLEDWKHAYPEQVQLLSSWGAVCANQIDIYKTPELAKALRQSFDSRAAWKKGAAGSWQGAFQGGFYARIGDGNTAKEILDLHIIRTVNPNLSSRFSIADWQIDGNFGQVNTINEMLLQSQSGVIDLLPALPDAWGNGNLNGFRARGGFTVNMNWKDHQLEQAAIISTVSGKCIIRPHQDVKVTRNNKLLKIVPSDDGLITVDTKAGDVLVLSKTL